MPPRPRENRRRRRRGGPARPRGGIVRKIAELIGVGLSVEELRAQVRGIAGTGVVPAQRPAAVGGAGEVDRRVVGPVACPEPGVAVGVDGDLPAVRAERIDRVGQVGRHAGGVQQRRRQVVELDRFGVAGARLHAAGPAHYRRHAEVRVVDRRALHHQPVVAEQVTVVGEEEHERVVGEAASVEHREQVADEVVDHPHLGVVADPHPVDLLRRQVLEPGEVVVLRVPSQPRGPGPRSRGDQRRQRGSVDPGLRLGRVVVVGVVGVEDADHQEPRWSGFARRWSGFARRWSGFARRWSGFARRWSGFARRWSGFARNRCAIVGSAFEEGLRPLRRPGVHVDLRGDRSCRLLVLHQPVEHVRPPLPQPRRVRVQRRVHHRPAAVVQLAGVEAVTRMTPLPLDARRLRVQLPDEAGAVAGVPQPLGEHRVLLRERRGDVIDAVPRQVVPGHERRPAGRADRVRTPRVVEQHAALAEAVEVRRGDGPVAAAAQRVRPLLVGHDHQQVRATLHRSIGSSKGEAGRPAAL